MRLESKSERTRLELIKNSANNPKFPLPRSSRRCSLSFLPVEEGKEDVRM